MNRVLAISKRQYMGRDLLDDRYGRFREIPLELARIGHQVRGVCLSYQPRQAGEMVDATLDGAVAWRSLNLGTTILPGALAHWRELRREASSFRPDVVLSFSDAFHTIRGVSLAQDIGAKSVVDLYDNFESFRGTMLPPVFRAFRRAVRDADLVCCVSPPLVRLVQERYGREGPTELLENGVRSDLFSPDHRTAARSRLGLRADARLAVVAGALSRSRDIETVFRAMDRLAQDDPPVALAVAGRRDEGLAWPTAASVHDLGILEHAQVPDLMRAADVVVVPNLDSPFGAYCHPQKACEAIACGVPVVAAATGSLAEALASEPNALYRVGDPGDLARVLSARLADPRPPTLRVAGWDEIARRLSEML